MLKDRILEAINFATEKHSGQKRRDGKTPFISHSLAVAILLTTVTNDSDVIIAGILHDVVEDTDVTIEEIRKLFGKKVARLVGECTEENQDSSWKDRKMAVLAKIKKISDEGALIKSADHLHNTFELRHKLEKNGKSFMNNFHASVEDKFNYDSNKLAELKLYHPNPLLSDLESELKKVKKLLGKKN